MELDAYLMSNSHNLFMAIVWTLGIIILSIPPNFTIRNWVFISAFDGTSKSDKKENYPLWQRILLWHAIDHNHSPKTKRRVICYLVWWCINILMAVMFFLREYNTISGAVVIYLYIPKLVFDVSISVVGLNWTEYKEKEHK